MIFKNLMKKRFIGLLIVMLAISAYVIAPQRETKADAATPAQSALKVFTACGVSQATPIYSSHSTILSWSNPACKGRIVINGARIPNGPRIVSEVPWRGLNGYPYKVSWPSIGTPGTVSFISFEMDAGAFGKWKKVFVVEHLNGGKYRATISYGY